MDKQTVAHPYNGMLLSDKKKWATEPKRDMMELKGIFLSGIRQSGKAYILLCQLDDVLEKAKL